MVEFQVTNNLASSSMLPLKTHLTAHPKIHVEKVVEMTTTTMNDIYYNLELYDFLNIDIQGAELKALTGFDDKLDSINYIYSEVNEQELYEGCCLLPELDEFLASKGFSRVETEMTRYGWGDALYIRNK